MKSRFRKEEGQTVVLTALCMTILMGFMALAVDVGMMFRAKRSLQSAADAAAVAAAIEMGYNGTTNITTVAQAAAALNGVTDGTQVAVNNPVTNGYHTGAGYVEVVITQPNPVLFMGVFGTSKLNVTARAVGGDPASAACMYILDDKPADSDVLFVKKTLTANNCGVQVNSPNANAVCLHGAGTVVADYLHIVGGLDSGGPCKASKNAPMQQGVAPVTDPFGDLTGPIPATDCKTGSGGNTTALTSITSTSQLPTPKANADGILSDQVYCFSGTNVVLDGGGSTLTLGPGIYVFEHGVNVGNVQVNGGTIDNAGGVFNQKNTYLGITAPTSGIYDGIALMQPSINNTAVS
jgi:hypothetical protein